MSLVKTSFLNGIAVAVKVGVAVVLNKLLAVYVGPSGYAAIGQFQNAIAVALSVSGGVILPGVTKSTAEHHDDETQQCAIWQSAVRLSLAGTLFASLVCLLAAPWLSANLLQIRNMELVFVGLGLALPAIAANNLLLAIINGKKEIAAYITTNILGSLLSLVIVGLFTYLWGLLGALLAVVISPAALLFITAALVSKRSWFHKKSCWGPGAPEAVRELGGFGLMGITSALTAPLSYMYIRSYLSSSLGVESAGYWQASWKISEIYLMLVTLTLSVYYLPRIAEIKCGKELKSEIYKVYRVVLPIVAIGAVTMFQLREFIVHTLFSAEFTPMLELFFWQLLGDVLKIGSWILSFVMLGKAMVRAFIVTEVTFSVGLCLAAKGLVDHFGLQGVSMAYAGCYFFYWIVMGFLIAGKIKSMGKENALA